MSRGPITLPPESLVGRTLVDLLASSRPLLGEGSPGLTPPAYYDIVLLLDGGEKVQLSHDSISAWNGTDPLAPVTTGTFRIDPKLIFRNQRIVAVRYDENDELLIELANRTTLQVTTDHGTLVRLERLLP